MEPVSKSAQKAVLTLQGVDGPVRTSAEIAQTQGRAGIRAVASDVKSEAETLQMQGRAGCRPASELPSTATKSFLA